MIRSPMLLAFSLALIGCAASPDKVSETYVVAEAELRPADAYATLCMADREVYTVEQYAERRSLASPSPLVQAVAERVELKSVVVVDSPGGKTSTVTISQPEYPDHATSDPDGPIAEIRAGRYVREEFPVTVHLQQEGGKWCVFQDFEKAELVRGLVVDATQMEQRGDTTGALAKWEHAASLGPNRFLDARVAALKRKAERAEEALAYRQMIQVSPAAVSTTEYDGVHVAGEVQNLGNRTVSKISLMIYGLDPSGQAVFEIQCAPPVDNEASAREPDKQAPLKPHYSRPYLGSIPAGQTSQWTGQVRVEVTDVQLAE